MNFDFTSTALCAGEAIDCRCLILATEFYQVSKREALELAEDITQWITELLREGFVSKTLAGGKRTAKEKPLWGLTEALSKQQGWAYSVEGMAVSPVVNNLKTYNSYFQNIRRGMFASESINHGVSIDYREFWDNMFTEALDNAQIKQNILRIFQESGKVLISHYDLPDVMATFWLTPYQKDSVHYQGSFALFFSSFCLGKSVTNMAEDFSLFAKQLSEKYIKLNARIMLQPNIGPWCNPYLSLFTTLQKADGSHEKNNCTLSEWYSKYYIPGAEWYNIISPLAQTHLHETLSAHPSIAVERISGGGLAVYSQKAIVDYDVPDALEMKRLVYPALYPGTRSFSFRTLFQDEIPKSTMSVFPRSNWAIIPVFEEEIDVAYSNITFSKVM